MCSEAVAASCTEHLPNPLSCLLSCSVLFTASSNKPNNWILLIKLGDKSLLIYKKKKAEFKLLDDTMLSNIEDIFFCIVWIKGKFENI